MRQSRFASAILTILAASVATCGTACAADATYGGRTRPHVRATAPTATNYHGGGFYSLPRGDALVGSIRTSASDPFSFNLFGDASYYDDGPACFLHGVGGYFYITPRFERVCVIGRP